MKGSSSSFLLQLDTMSDSGFPPDTVQTALIDANVSSIMLAILLLGAYGTPIIKEYHNSTTTMSQIGINTSVYIATMYIYCEA